MDHLLSEKQRGLEDAAAMVESKDQVTAAIAVGGVRFCESLWSILHPPEKPTAKVEEPFVDPSLR